jgi:hypothetical protein
MKSKLLVYPSQERTHELFEYREDNISQPFLWKIKLNVRIRIGDAAGTVDKSNGYYKIQINKKMYRLHRLVWIYHNGDIPDEISVDHIDGNKANNRIENLRLATHTENMQNSKIRSDNTSGIKGVRILKNGKLVAEIKVNGKRLWLGTFNTLEEAEAVVIAARNNLHGEFVRHE